MQRTATLTKANAFGELSITMFAPPVISLPRARRKRMPEKPISITTFLAENHELLNIQVKEAGFTRHWNTAHVPASSEEVIIEKAKKEKRPFQLLPEAFTLLLREWAAYFGHRINERKGYIYLNRLTFKTYVFCDPTVGVMINEELEADGAKAYINLYMGKRLRLKAENYLLGIEIDLIKELQQFEWLKKNRKFNSALERALQ